LNPGLVVFMNTDMDLFELILFDVIIVLIFVCFLITAVFFTDNNLFLMFLSLAFGLFSLPFSRTLGCWWTFLRSQEREKLHICLDNTKKTAGWIFLDFGLKGNARMFRGISLATAVFAVVDLVRYLVG
jgi:hypothetical protein